MPLLFGLIGLCCGLLRREIVQCNLGCAPWRMLSSYPNGSQAARPLAPVDADACAASHDDGGSGGGGLGAALWEQPAERGAETELLHPNRKQTWANGAMRCDFCEGFFNGWRGF